MWNVGLIRTVLYKRFLQNLKNLNLEYKLSYLLNDCSIVRVYQVAFLNRLNGLFWSQRNQIIGKLALIKKKLSLYRRFGILCMCSRTHSPNYNCCCRPEMGTVSTIPIWYLPVIIVNLWNNCGLFRMLFLVAYLYEEVM